MNVNKNLMIIIAGLLLSACQTPRSTSPIPGAPDEWFHGNETYITENPEKACDAFNNNVALINAFIEQNYGETNVVYNYLCTHIKVNDQQIEHTASYHLPVAGWWGRDWEMDDYVDVARTIDVLLFSQTNRTDYLMFINGDANLKRQEQVENGDVWLNQNVAPFFYYRDGHFGNNWHGTSQINFVAGDIAVDNARDDAMDHFGGNPPSDEALLAKMMEILSDQCTNDFENSTCIPGGGAINSPHWYSDESFPESTYQEKYVNITTSQTMGFDFSGEFGADSDGPAGGMSVGFNYSTTTEASDELAMFYVQNYPYANDVASRMDYTMSGVAVGAVADTGNIQYYNDEWDYRVSNADEMFGEQTWRRHDLSSVETWHEELDPVTCLIGPVEEIAFGNTLNLARSTIDFDGSNWAIDQNDTETVTHRFDYGIILETECEEDSDGNLYRLLRRGALNQ